MKKINNNLLRTDLLAYKVTSSRRRYRNYFSLDLHAPMTGLRACNLPCTTAREVKNLTFPVTSRHGAIDPQDMNTVSGLRAEVLVVNRILE